MTVIERSVSAPVALIGERDRDIVTEKVDGRDLPLPARARDREQTFAGGNEELIRHQLPS